MLLLCLRPRVMNGGAGVVKHKQTNKPAHMPIKSQTTANCAEISHANVPLVSPGPQAGSGNVSSTVGIWIVDKKSARPYVYRR